MSIPIIDVTSLVENTPEKYECAKKIRDVCIEHGFFYIVGHGIDEDLQNRLESISKQFFDKPLDIKNKIKIGSDGKGFFSTGEEVTSGRPDIKSGLYFGDECDSNHPGVQEGNFWYGKNKFPDDDLPEMRLIVNQYIDAMVELGHKVLKGLALSLELDENFFYDNYTKDPSLQFCIFKYPVPDKSVQIKDDTWGVGEHSDYGFLTMLKQDDCGGLEIKSNSKWIQAPPVHNSFICNIGDMLDKLTRGVYKSTPHRVKVSTLKDRFSYPIFIDPNYSAEIKIIDSKVIDREFKDDKDERWDRESVHEVKGIFGEYRNKKLLKIFPEIN